MNPWLIKRTIDMQKWQRSMEYLGVLAYSGNEKGHRIELTMRSGETNLPLDGYTVRGYFYLGKPENPEAVMPVKGSASGNLATLDFPAEAYAVGQASIVVCAEKTGEQIPLYSGSYTVRNGSAKVILDPSKTIPSLSTLLNEIEDMRSVTADGRAQQEQVAQAESSRVSAEQTRVTAEQSRVTAEQERASSESSRASAEQARGTAEQNRAAAEQGRNTAETSRASAEQSRVNAEQKRVTAESSRVSAETERMAAETARAEAETQRAQTFAGYEGEIGSLKADLDELDGVVFKTVVGKNILPPNIMWNENKGLNIENGNLLTLDGQYTSDYIEVDNTKKYTFVSATGNIVQIGGRVLGYDANKNYVGINAQVGGNIINAQEGIKCVRFTCGNEAQANSIVAIVPYVEGKNNGYDISFYGEIKEENYVRKDEIQKNNDDIPSMIENRGDVITKFSDYTSTYKNGTGSVVEKTSEKTQRAKQSVKLFLTSGGNQVKFYGVPLKCDANDDVGVFIYAFSDNVSSLNLVADENKVILSTSKMYLLRGWNYLKINTSEAIDTQNIVLSVDCSSDAEIYLDSIVKGYRLKPTVLFSFDTLLDTDIFGSDENGYGSIYDTMSDFGFAGTVAFQSGGFPSSSLAPITRKRYYYDLVANGWDYGYYNGDCIDVPRPVTVSDTPDDTAVYDKSRYSDWENFINKYKDRLADNGYFDPISYFCRYNLTSTNITGVCMENGTKIVRMACSEKIINHYDSESIELPVIHVTDSVDGNNIQFVKDKIDYVIANGKALGLMTHRLENLDNATKDSYCSTTAFREILAYIKEKVDTGDLQVLTYEEFYKSFYQDDYEKLLVSRRAKKDCWLEEKLLAN